MDSAIPTPAKAMMSGPCFVLCASHSTKNALFCNMVRKGGCASTFKRLPVRTALMSSSALAECLVSESARQSSLHVQGRASVHCCFPFSTSGSNALFLSVPVDVLWMLWRQDCSHQCGCVHLQFRRLCLTRGREEIMLNRNNALVRATLQQ